MKNEKKAWFIILLFPLIISLPLIFLNVVVDNGSYFHSETTKSIAKEIINGNQVYLTSPINERKVKEEVIKAIPESVKTVCLGNSLIMTLNEEILHKKPNDFYNLGVSDANIYDYCNTLGMLKYYNKSVEEFIILLHIDVFLSPSTDYYREQINYGKYYINYLKKKRTSLNNASLYSFIYNFPKLFSISYFENNISYLMKNGIFRKKHYSLTNENGSPSYMADASWVYDDATIKRTEKDVLVDVSDGKKHLRSGHVSKKNVELFDKLFYDLLDSNHKIVLYLSPYCPAFTDEYINKLPCLAEIEDVISKYENEKNVTIVGSFYPEKLGLKNEDYYDSVHIRRESLNKAFKHVEN